jgi:hypothetical protein
LVTFVDYGNTQLCGKLLFAKSFTRIAVDFNLFHLEIVLFVAVILKKKLSRFYIPRKAAILFAAYDVNNDNDQTCHRAIFSSDLTADRNI